MCMPPLALQKRWKCYRNITGWSWNFSVVQHIVVPHMTHVQCTIALEWGLGSPGSHSAHLFPPPTPKNKGRGERVNSHWVHPQGMKALFWVALILVPCSVTAQSQGPAALLSVPHEGWQAAREWAHWWAPFHCWGRKQNHRMSHPSWSPWQESTPLNAFIPTLHICSMTKTCLSMTCPN